MIDTSAIRQHLIGHMEMLTRTIGERSVATLGNLEASAQYIESFYRTLHLQPARQTYQYHNNQVANIIVDIGSRQQPNPIYLVGAHYDSVRGTVGADDNASAIAVQLEVARQLVHLHQNKQLQASARLVSFALEEPPTYATKAMGSRVYARQAKKRKERIDGMICLEMVGYTCSVPGCQRYPFPLQFRGYPKIGNFIGIVGNFRSRGFTKSLLQVFQQNADLPAIALTVPWSGYFIPSVRLSDHASFWDRGYRAVMLTDTAFFRNPHYHSRADTMEKLDYDFMSQLVQSLTLFFRQARD